MGGGEEERKIAVYSEKRNFMKGTWLSKLWHKQENIWGKMGLGFESKVSEGWEVHDHTGDEVLQDGEN